MFGADVLSKDLKGIIPRACEHIFKYIESDSSGTEFTIKCSFLEIYKEVVRDLLDPDRVNLKVRETPSRGVWVDQLSEQARLVRLLAAANPLPHDFVFSSP